MMKPYLTTIFLLIGLSCLYSCRKEKVDCCVTRDSTIEISFVDARGNDLLNSGTSKSFSTENVDLFYLNNGQKERVYNSNMDYSENFFVFEANGKYNMRLFPSEYVVDDKSTTYIQFS